MSQDRQLLIAPAVRVTLLEDRARVVRRGQIQLTPGVQRICVPDVAPIIADKTLLATADPGSKVLGSHVRRRIDVVHPDDAGAEGSAAKLAAEGERLDGEIARILDQKTALERRASGLDETARMSLDELAEDVAWGRAVEEVWHQRFDQLRGEERTIREKIHELSEELRELYAAHDRLGGRIAELRNPPQKEVAELELVVESEGGEVEFDIEYTVPGALWRPYHVARLDSAGQIHFRTDACIWQNTGEDWDGVDLLFSTERPSLGTEPPQLDDDELAVQRKSTQVVVETREEDVQTTGLGASTGVVAAEVPGVDDGGELVHLQAPHPATVPSDGRAHRVQLLEFHSGADAELIALPELSPCVFTRTVITNESRTPLLAGPVDLIRESGLVGRTSILYVASGERFELGWGPEAEIRVKRTDESMREKARMLSSWVTRGHSIEVLLSNLGGDARMVRVRERIPVSETDKVKVELDRKSSSPDCSVDEQGFIEWQIELEPFSQASRKIRYVVKKHEDVVGI